MSQPGPCAVLSGASYAWIRLQHSSSKLNVLGGNAIDLTSTIVMATAARASLDNFLAQPDWTLRIPPSPYDAATGVLFDWDSGAVFMPLRGSGSLVHKPNKTPEQQVRLESELQDQLHSLVRSKGNRSWHVVLSQNAKWIRPSQSQGLRPQDVEQGGSDLALLVWRGSNSVLTVYQRAILRSLAVCAAYLPSEFLLAIAQRSPPFFGEDEEFDDLWGRIPSAPSLERIMRPTPSGWSWNARPIASSLFELDLKNSDLAPEALDGLTRFLLGNATLSLLCLSANRDLFKDEAKVARFARSVGYSALQTLRLSTWTDSHLRALEPLLLNLHSRTLTHLHLSNLGVQESGPISLTHWNAEMLSPTLYTHLSSSRGFTSLILAAFILRSAPINPGLAMALQQPLLDPLSRTSGDNTPLAHPTYAPFSPGGVLRLGCPRLRSLWLQGDVFGLEDVALMMACMRPRNQGARGWQDADSISLGNSTLETPPGSLVPTLPVSDDTLTDPDAQAELCALVAERAYEIIVPPAPHTRHPKAHRRDLLADTSRILLERTTSLLHPHTAPKEEKDGNGLRHTAKELGRINFSSNYRARESALAVLAAARVLGCRVEGIGEPSGSPYSLWLSLPAHLRAQVLGFLGPGLTRTQLRSVLSFAADRRTIGYNAYREAFLVSARLQQERDREQAQVHERDARTLRALHRSGTVDARELEQDLDPILDQHPFSFREAYLLHGPPHRAYKELDQLSEGISPDDGFQSSFWRLTGTDSSLL